MKATPDTIPVDDTPQSTRDIDPVVSTWKAHTNYMDFALEAEDVRFGHGSVVFIAIKFPAGASWAVGNEEEISYPLELKDLARLRDWIVERLSDQRFLLESLNNSSDGVSELSPTYDIVETSLSHVGSGCSVAGTSSSHVGSGCPVVETSLSHVGSGCSVAGTSSSHAGSILKNNPHPHPVDAATSTAKERAS